ncbi:GNAT family N-acetyltransferase [Falsiroseomonas oryzae]|uniref:GNAT family N-acetyltransferase n=1 Tax=Falsiroseomonas oryzae TaxID=2766473 RepID=UPI0022EB4589|nr:GNAT family N-acetyltransferase [Roseomonas sp. MO-31]
MTSDATRAMPGVLEVERATLTAVPAPRIAFDGGFVLRSFAGGTGRANAACPLDPTPDPALEARIARIEGFYTRVGLRPRFRSTPLDPPGLAGLLTSRGYAPHDESHVICGLLSGFAAADPACEILAGPADPWMEVLATAEHQVPARREEKARMPELLGVPAAWILLRSAGIPAACAFVTADGPLAGLFDLVVRPEFRRRGLGQRVMAAAGAWAVEQGARFAYAQVACSNAASLALNAGLGLTELYRYRYLLPETAAR